MSAFPHLLSHIKQLQVLPRFQAWPEGTWEGRQPTASRIYSIKPSIGQQHACSDKKLSGRSSTEWDHWSWQ